MLINCLKKELGKLPIALIGGSPVNSAADFFMLMVFVDCDFESHI